MGSENSPLRLWFFAAILLALGVYFVLEGKYFYLVFCFMGFLVIHRFYQDVFKAENDEEE